LITWTLGLTVVCIKRVAGFFIPARFPKLSHMALWRCPAYGGLLWEALNSALQVLDDKKKPLTEKELVESIQQEFRVTMQYGKTLFASPNCLSHAFHGAKSVLGDFKTIKPSQLVLVKGGYENEPAEEHFGLVLKLAEGEVLIDPTYNRFVIIMFQGLSANMPKIHLE